MLDWLPGSVRLILLGAVAVGIGLVTLANAYPEAAWLRSFRLAGQLTEEQKRRLGRRIDAAAGIQLIALGLLFPVGYLVLTAVFFSGIDAQVMTASLVLAGVCVAIGTWILFRAR